VGVFDAVWGGLSSFFSVWQFCILQISPFFMAYIVGIYLSGISENNPGIAQRVILPCIAYMIGFSIIFSLLSSTGLTVGRSVFRNIGTLRFMSGVYVFFVSLFIILSSRIDYFKKKESPLFFAGVSLILGASFAFVYSPCIPPTLSKILNMAAFPEKAMRGSLLAFYYGIGLSFSFGFTAFVLTSLLKWSGVLHKKTTLFRNISGIILLIFSFLSITGLMLSYKAFILGFMVK